ncbi:site-specific DNA-methyltransferase [Oceanobacter sp. 3_MG-2023]|uniref:site-specific DNA-methyltransferase n=1 Tax=Oceanobacter sp. 3_MG-2023 TaxID=3062622 RepID=UPI002732AF53|nr:site-specific DNA-methyltransferase [Oceanobacter sp. 3_MG-2023]MDP2505974.1 site-specific DNA-methyltransferase [Oceanobacter sp. 3_MG-2023]
MKKVIPEMDSKSMDIVADNISKLKALFPEVFTEGKVDFDALKTVLGEYIDDHEERYSFTWNGKTKARMLAQTPSAGTLRPCKEESVDWDSTQNLFIEGDNLEVLKLLQKSYHKKVKMIYIDPPYNTGKDFVYKDNFKDNIKNYKEITGQVDGEGRNLSSNPETSGRYHTDWLNMMYPRLKLARNLLKDDGVIFISIDEVEVSNLINICDEIFGEENRLGTIVWKKKTNGNNMGYIPPVHDYFLVYSRIASDNCLLGFPLSDEFIEKTYSNSDDDPKGPWTTSDLSANHVGPYFEIINPETGEGFLPPQGRYWVFSEEEVKKRISEGRIIFGKSGNGRPIQKKFLKERSSMRKKAESWWDSHGMNEDGSSEIAKIIAPKVFSHPKPSVTIKHISNICTQNDDLVLDFFSGSGSTAHSIFDLNIEDGGSRKFILIQLPEITDEKSEAFKSGYRTIAEIGKERIRRVSGKIKEENPDYQGDLGFKVFKLDSTNIKPWELDFDLTEQDLEDQVSNIKPDRKEDDVLYEVLLKYGLDLTLPITEHSVAGHKVFDIGMGALMICLSDDITTEVAEGIAKLKDELNPEIMRVVFKDAGFADDVVKTNAVQILKQASIEDVRSL